jgi:hypothetical protein
MHTATSDALIFGTGGNNERMRIDSTGRLLVGKSVTTFGTAGHTIYHDGSHDLTASAIPPIQANRLSSDGDIIGLYKDSGRIGGIGSKSSKPFFVNPTNFGIRLANNALVATDESGTNESSASDLGASDVKWKNLHLSGSVQLYGSGEGITFGSTASAAHTLDDYEEGTWTPTLLGSTSNPTVSYTTQSGYYTKIGNAVSLFCRLQTSAVSGGSGHARVGGLPFANHSTAKSGAAIGIVSGVDLTSGYTQYGFTGTASATTLDYVQSGDNLTASVINLSAIAASSNHDIFFTYTYTT